MWQFGVETIREWWNDDVPTLAAATAFYTVFSFAPSLMIAVAVASMFYGREAARGEIVDLLRLLTGSATPIFEAVLEQAQARSALATTLGVAASLFGATAAFVALQNGLNTIWGVAIKPGHDVKMFFRKRVLSFVLVLGGGLLLLSSLIAGTLLETTIRFLEGSLPVPAIVLEAVQFVASLVLVMLLFAGLYKILPDVKITWSDVWIGAAGTSFFFTVGKTLLGVYLARSTLGSVYGAAGSFVLMLVWVYYSVQIFFLGGEFTQVYARRHGTPLVPADYAVQISKPRSPQQETIL